MVGNILISGETGIGEHKLIGKPLNGQNSKVKRKTNRGENYLSGNWEREKAVKGKLVKGKASRWENYRNLLFGFGT